MIKLSHLRAALEAEGLPVADADRLLVDAAGAVARRSATGLT